MISEVPLSVNWPQTIIVAISMLTISTTIIAWFVRLERRLSGVLTRKEHSDICEGHQKEIKATLKELRDIVETRDEKANTFREKAQENLTNISIKILPLELRLTMVEKDVQGLRDWKHVVVDPYVPRAIEEHERRLNRMEPIK